jgi:3',5'-cyclic-AMP phosphodiesterase
LLLSLLSLQSACIQLSPFETDLAADERDHTRKNLDRLQARGAPGGAIKLGVIADNHAHYDELSELVAILNERGDLDLVLHAGDMTDFGLRHEYRWSLERLRQLDAPWLTVIGNHDAVSNGRTIYRGMFGSFDYAFDLGPLRFVCFNSNRLEFGSGVPRWDFVESAAVSPEGGGVVLLTHQLPAGAELAPDGALTRLLRTQRVTLMLHGHLHDQSLEFVGKVPSLIAGASENLRYAIVTIENAEARVELCRARSCAAAEPPP